MGFYSYTHDNIETTREGLEVIEKVKRIDLNNTRNNNKCKYDVHHCRELIKAEAVKRGWIKPEDDVFLRILVYDRGIVGSAKWELNDALTEDEIRYCETPAWRRSR